MANLKTRNLAMEGPKAEPLRDERQESNKFPWNLKVTSIMDIEGGKEMPLAKVVSGEKVSLEKFMI